MFAGKIERGSDGPVQSKTFLQIFDKFDTLKISNIDFQIQGGGNPIVKLSDNSWNMVCYLTFTKMQVTRLWVEALSEVIVIITTRKLAYYEIT